MKRFLFLTVLFILLGAALLWPAQAPADCNCGPACVCPPGTCTSCPACVNCPECAAAQDRTEPRQPLRKVARFVLRHVFPRRCR
jgi:hypothetical protein